MDVGSMGLRLDQVEPTLRPREVVETDMEPKCSLQSCPQSVHGQTSRSNNLLLSGLFPYGVIHLAGFAGLETCHFAPRGFRASGL